MSATNWNEREIRGVSRKNPKNSHSSTRISNSLRESTLFNRSCFFHFKFTIIELLIVISIISILITLLLPALSKARGMSKRIVCSSNMRQIYLAAINYADDSNNDLPLPRKQRWTIDIAKQLGVFNGTTTYPGWKSVEGPLICPSTIPPGEGPYWLGTYTGEPINTSYGPTVQYTYDDEVNTSHWGGWYYAYCAGNSGTTLSTKCKKLNKVTNHSVILIEKCLYMEAWHICFPYNYNFPWASNQSFATSNKTIALYGTSWRHQNQANFLFIDGHVQAIKGGTLFNNDWTLK